MQNRTAAPLLQPVFCDIGQIGAQYTVERTQLRMGPKKGDKKTSSKVDGEVLGEDPLQLLQNYQRFSKLIGISPNQKIVAQLQSDENQPLAQVRLQPGRPVHT